MVLVTSTESEKGTELAFQKQLEISKLEEIFLNAEYPVVEKLREEATFTPVFIANRTEKRTTDRVSEKSPARAALEAARLATKENNHPVLAVPLKSALTGVYDLHETINTDCDLHQTHFTSYNDDFVAGQLECREHKASHQVQQQPVGQASSRKRTIEEMDRLLQSVFEENDDDDNFLGRTEPVVKRTSLRESAKLFSKPNAGLQSIVGEIIRPSYERTSATATRQLDATSHTRENVATLQPPLKNPYKVVEILEATGQGSRNHQEVSRGRFQRDLSKRFQAPLRPFNAENRNLNSYATLNGVAGKIPLDVTATLKNTSNGVQPLSRECQMKKLQQVFTGGKCPDELTREFHLKF